MKYIYKTKRQDIWALTLGPASKEEKEEVDSRPRKQQKKTQVYGGCRLEKDEERAALKEIENKQLFLGSSFYYWNVGEENKKRLTVDSRNEIRLTKETRIKLYCQPPVSSLTTFPLLGFFHLVTARH